MRISKKQLRFIGLVEKCRYLLRNEVNTQEFPETMINALIKKGLLREEGSKLISTTGED